MATLAFDSATKVNAEQGHPLGARPRRRNARGIAFSGILFSLFEPILGELNCLGLGLSLQSRPDGDQQIAQALPDARLPFRLDC
jgi:hypothetical protein